MTLAPTPLSDREIAVSWLAGVESVPPLSARNGLTPREAIEKVLLEHWRPPVVIAFSGGRDSSVLLAIAVDVARRHGLPDPVPVTEVFPGDERSDESSWQELVVRHLGVREWCRLRLAEDADLLGPQAQRSLSRHGVVWPPAVHLKSRLLAVASGGVMVTGEGGDEVLGSSRNGALREVVVEHRWRGRRHVGALATTVAPRPVRQAAALRRLRRADDQTWLTDTLRRWHRRRVADDLASEPLARADVITWTARRRVVRESTHTRRAVARTYEVDLVDPFLHSDVVAALSRAAGFWGWRGRTSALRQIVPDLLPDQVLARQSKALFNTAYFGAAARQFAEQWDGSGLDPALVHAERLKAEWLSERPSALSFLPLQAAWAATRTIRSES